MLEGFSTKTHKLGKSLLSMMKLVPSNTKLASVRRAACSLEDEHKRILRRGNGLTLDTRLAIPALPSRLPPRWEYQ